MKSRLLAILLCFGVNCVFAKQPILTAKELDSPPPKIIRTCCSFGADMKMMGLPGVKITEVISVAELGTHKYLGDKKTEGNGIIYTRNGGFIDMGHLRDCGDWTAYLYNQIIENRGKGFFEKTLGHEGGLKTLSLTIPETMTDADAIQLAGAIAYDLSVWHEISTWYGASYIPFLPERFSSFSIEDAYSNLLGVQLSMKAIASELPYEEAMTQLIETKLTDLEAVETKEESLAAMEDVREIWWTRTKKLPSKKVLLERELEVYPTVQPYLVAGWSTHNSSDFAISVPKTTATNDILTNYYQLSFKLNQKVPFRKLFPERKKRLISQRDFPYILRQIAIEIHIEEEKQRANEEKKLAKLERKDRDKGKFRKME